MDVTSAFTYAHVMASSETVPSGQIVALGLHMFGLRASKNRLEKGTRSSISQCTQPALILSWPVPACIGHRYVALSLASRVLQRPVVWDGALTITENSQKLPFRQPIAVRHQQLDTQATA